MKKVIPANENETYDCKEFIKMWDIMYKLNVNIKN